MKAWLLTLETACLKKFYQKETDEIVSYYKEMIEERLSHGEKIDNVLASYQIEQIVNDMTPTMIAKRENESFKSLIRSAKVLVIALITIPLLLPLGVFMIVIFSIIFALGVTFVSLIFAGIVTIIAVIIESLTSGLPLPSLFVILGLGLMLTTMISMISIWLFKVFKSIIQKTIYYISIYAKKIQGEKR